MASYLITGKGGQLANAFEKHFAKYSINYVAIDITGLDITDFNGITHAVEQYRPQAIINCAAYNLVDKAEVDFYEAYKINAIGPKLLALAAERYSCRLVHYSSDYVFDGLKETGLYVENDPAAPINEYGKGKLMGERLVLETLQGALIFRLSWVFGEGQQNFIYKLLQWQKDRDYLRIASDEFSVPTCTETVVEVTMNALETGLTGLYHLTNSGYCSRYEWASFVLNKMGIKRHIHPVSMSVFELPAKRPKFSAMDNTKVSEALHITIPSWQDKVEEHLKAYWLS